MSVPYLLGWMYAITYFSVIAHEAGHFVVAYLTGCPIARVQIGIGPKIVSFFWRGIRFRFNLIPDSGAVILCWDSRRAWKKIAVSAGGPASNALIAAAAWAANFYMLEVFSIWCVIVNLSPLRGSDGCLIAQHIKSALIGGVGAK